MTNRAVAASVAGVHHGIICDLDGVVYRGSAAVSGAVSALRECPVPIQYATNNASRPPAEVANHLRALGLPTEPEAVTTSAQAGADLLADLLSADSEVLVLGGSGVTQAISDVGLRPVRVGGITTDAVLQGFGACVDADALAEAAYVIQRGARWVATNTDLTLPTDRGLAPGNGTLVAAVASAVGREPDAVAGKPHAPLYRLCAARLDAPPARILTIGDRLETDIRGACGLGMPSVLVLTGVHGVRDALLAPVGSRPSWVVPDLGWLYHPVDDPGITSVCRVLASVWSARDAGVCDEAQIRGAHADIDRILAVGSTVS